MHSTEQLDVVMVVLFLIDSLKDPLAQTRTLELQWAPITVVDTSAGCNYSIVSN